MKQFFPILPALLVITLFAGCADFSAPFGGKPASPGTSALDAATPQQAARLPGLAAPPPKPGARTAAALDTTTPAQRAAAVNAPKTGGERALGRVSVALGNVTEPGFWLRGAVVKTAGAGRVVTASGASVQVELLPGMGAAQLSLAAYRALGLGLTDLPEVTVFAR